MGAILCASDVLEVRGGKDESCFDEKQTTSTGSNQSMKLSTAVILISVYC